MTNLTAWAAGKLAATYTSAFGSEINSLPTGDAVLSSVTFDNSSVGDQFMDISAVCALVAAETLSNAALSFWIAYLQADGVTYGDGRLTTTPAAYTPLTDPIAAIQFVNGTTITNIIGDLGPFMIRPTKFALIVQNNAGFALAAAAGSISIKTYVQNLNA